MKKNNKENMDVFMNRFTGEELSTYPTPFANLSKKASKKTTDKEKLNKQVESFKNRHTCKFCGEKREWIEGTNLMVCKNPACKGYTKTFLDKEGKEVIISTPSFKILTRRGAAIANTILQ